MQRQRRKPETTNESRGEALVLPDFSLFPERVRDNEKSKFHFVSFPSRCFRGKGRQKELHCSIDDEDDDKKKEKVRQ